MPCWTTTSTEVQIDKNTNITLLHAALEKLKLNPRTVAREAGVIYFQNGSYNQSTGTLTLRGEVNPSEKVAEIKRAYSAQIVLSTAKRAGWQTTEMPNGQIQLKKGY